MLIIFYIFLKIGNGIINKKFKVFISDFCFRLKEEFDFYIMILEILRGKIICKY